MLKVAAVTCSLAVVLFSPAFSEGLSIAPQSAICDILPGRGWQGIEFDPSARRLFSTRIVDPKDRDSPAELLLSENGRTASLLVSREMGHGADLGFRKGTNPELWTGNQSGDGATRLTLSADYRSVASLDNFVLFPGYKTTQVATSVDGTFILAQAGRAGQREIRGWRASDLAKNSGAPPTWSWPIAPPNKGLPFQGLTADGDTVYSLWGTSRSGDNIVLTAHSFDGRLRWERELDNQPCVDPRTVRYLEPEGLAWRQCDGGKLCLTMGLGSGTGLHLLMTGIHASR